MRIGELLELQVADIDLPEQKIMIYIGEKNYQGRVVYFSDDAREALLAWLAIRNPEKRYLFYGRCGPLTYVSAWYRITNCFKKAGLSQKPYSPHCLRHTFATEVLNAGMRLEVVQQLLGHQSIELTRRYAKLSSPTREDEYFRAMTKIEKGGPDDEPDRFNHKLQAVFEKKKLFTAHD
jgi:site-specific recombinase XerD